MHPMHNRIYDFIDPKSHYDQQTYAGKVVVVMGASRGIGAETALQYACAGASVVLSSRKLSALEDVKSGILKEVPGAEILTVAADVTQTKEVEQAIAETIAKFGRLDILIANAGKATPWNKSESFIWT